MLWLPPQLRYWHEIERQYLRDYLATYDGRSDTHRRLSLQPIVQTANYMEREHEARNVAKGLRLGNRNQRPTPIVYLADVLDFLKHLGQYGREWLEVGAALQALAGLRMTEALRLTWDKVDLERGLIVVSGEVKNEACLAGDSTQTIPAYRR